MNKINIFITTLLFYSLPLISMYPVKGASRFLYNYFTKSQTTQAENSENNSTSPLFQPKNLTTNIFPALYVQNKENAKKTTDKKTTLTHNRSVQPYDLICNHKINSVFFSDQKNTSIQNYIKNNKREALIISALTVYLLYNIHKIVINNGNIVLEHLNNKKIEYDEKKIEYRKKQIAKEKLYNLAHVSHEEFRSITVQNLEDIFLSENLDLINDFYKVPCICNREDTLVVNQKDSCKPYFIINERTVYKPDCITLDKISKTCFVLYKKWNLNKFDLIKLDKNAKNCFVLYAEDSLLTMACRAGNFEVCKWLLEHGADPNLRGKKKGKKYVIGDTSLIACLYDKDHEKIKPYVELLFQYTANPNAFSYVQFICSGDYLGREKMEKSTFMFNIATDYNCDICEERSRIRKECEYHTSYTHSAQCDNIKSSIIHGGIQDYPFIQPWMISLSFWKRLFFEDFDPNQENLLPFIAYMFRFHHEEKKALEFLQLLLAYGHEAKKFIQGCPMHISEFIDIDLPNAKKEHFLFSFNHNIMPLIEKEYEFRKAFSDNPQELFLELIKRCKRPDLFIERISDEMEISEEKQNSIIRELCLYSLTSLNDILKGGKNELSMTTQYKVDSFIPLTVRKHLKKNEGRSLYDFSQTISYMLDNLHKKGMLIFDKEIKEITTKIILDGLQKLYEKNDAYKGVFPLIECCSNNPQSINWLQKKEGKNIFHLLAYGINNRLLDNIIKNLQEHDSVSLQNALKQPMRLTRFSKETHTTPLYVATKESFDDFKCIESRKLLANAEYTQYSQTYRHNPYIIDNTYADKINIHLLKNYQKYSHTPYVG